jgi:hypothetical protein
MERGMIKVICLNIVVLKGIIFFELHRTSEILTTHALSSLWTHACKSSDWRSYHMRLAVDINVTFHWKHKCSWILINSLPWGVKPRTWGATRALITTRLQAFRVKRDYCTICLPKESRHYHINKKYKRIYTIEFFSDGAMVKKWWSYLNLMSSCWWEETVCHNCMRWDNCGTVAIHDLYSQCLAQTMSKDGTVA